MATLTDNKTGKVYPDLLAWIDDLATNQAICKHDDQDLRHAETKKFTHYAIVCNDCNKITEAWKEIIS